MRIMKPFFALTAAATAIAAVPASSAIIINFSAADVCSGCENVHIDTDGPGNTTTVYGDVAGGTDNVIFTGTENITATGHGAGVVWVGDTDGTSTSLDIATIAGTTFSSLGFNLNEPQGPNKLPGNPSWGVRLSAFDSSGFLDSEDFFGFSHNTKFRVDSIGGGMQHVLIQFLDLNGNPAGPDGYPYNYETPKPNDPEPHTAFAYLEAVGQVRMDGVVTEVPSVPEPSTWAMMLMGFGGVGMSLRARKRRAAMTVVSA